MLNLGHQMGTGLSMVASRRSKFGRYSPTKIELHEGVSDPIRFASTAASQLLVSNTATSPSDFAKFRAKPLSVNFHLNVFLLPVDIDVIASY